MKEEYLAFQIPRKGKAAYIAVNRDLFADK